MPEVKTNKKFIFIEHLLKKQNITDFSLRMWVRASDWEFREITYAWSTADDFIYVATNA